MNWKSLLCLIGWHRSVLVLELPVKAIISGGSLSIPIDDPSGGVRFKGKNVCLWCGKVLKTFTKHVTVRMKK